MVRRMVLAQLALLAGGLACTLSDLTGETVAELEARQAAQSEQLAELDDRLAAIQAELASQSESIEALRSDLADHADELANTQTELGARLQDVIDQVDELAAQLELLDQSAQQTLRPTGELLYADDFSSTSSGWEVGNYTTGRVGYGNGYYLVTSDGLGGTMWGVANQRFADLVVSVEATQIQAPSNDNNDYGVICRLQPDGQGYYFLISGDGFYSILRADDADFVALVDWRASNAIRQGNDANHITAVCDGSQLSMTVNGELLGSVSDSTYVSGDLALTATSYEDEGTEIHFDDLAVTQP